jgi:hypothetical protein
VVCLNKSIYGTKVFITKTASYFPNEPVGNEEMEDGEKILLLVPESGRFSYGVVLLTVRKKLC